MQKILVPFDGSPNALRAVEHVALLAGLLSQTPGIDLVVVHDPVTPRLHAGLTHAEISGMLNDEGERILQPARGILDAAHLPFTTTHLIGSVPHEIDRHARASGATAIVMGTRGLGRVAGALLGSAAAGVVRLAHVPVTLVK